MSDCEDFILKCDISKLKFELIHAIDDSTLTQSYTLRTNVCCTGNAFTLGTEIYGTKLQNKAEMRRIVSIFKKAKKKPIRLMRMDNSLGYTRLVYGFD